MYSREATGGAQGARAPSLPRDGSLPPVAPPLEGVERAVPEQGAYSDAEEESCLAPATRGEADAVPARLPSGWAVGTFSTSNSRHVYEISVALNSTLYSMHYTTPVAQSAVDCLWARRTSGPRSRRTPWLMP